MMILLTGGAGQVGSSIQRQAQALSLPIVAPTREMLDLSDSKSIKSFLASQKWSAIISAGAYTAVDQAESEPVLADAINAKAPHVLARFCKKHNIPLVHLSTDYVFSGDQKHPYKEMDETSPLGVYGRSKRLGEQAIMSSGCKAVILRTAWVVSPYGKNFIKTMLRLARERDEIRVVSDQYGSPTGAPDLAAVVLFLLSRLMREAQSPKGLYHCANQGETTWAELARAVMTESARMGGPAARIIDIATADYPTPAKRPQNSRLNCDQIQQDWGIKLRPWQSMVAETVAILLQEKGITS